MATGEAIKKLRLSKKMEQEEFAESIGITRSWLNKVENNKAPISDKIIANIESAFNVSLSEEKSSEVRTPTHTLNINGKTITVDQDKLIQRMCEWISLTVAAVQVLKAKQVAIEARVTGEDAAAISVELDALIAKVDSNLWEEFVRKWS